MAFPAVAKSVVSLTSIPLEEMAEHLPVPVVYTDAHWRVLWLNQAFCEALGCVEEEVIGRSMLSLFPEEETYQVRQYFDSLQTAAGGVQNTVFEARVRTRQGAWRAVNIRSRRITTATGAPGWVHLMEFSQDGEGNLLNYMSDLFVQGWVQVLHARDLETSAHAHRVSQMVIKMGRELGLNDRMLTLWRWGALLHDIGKVAIPDNILRKPGPLTPTEWSVMRQHPLLAKRVLDAAPFLPPEVFEIPLYHHERWDGSGYPFGLAGEEIPLGARAFAIVDVWDALRSERPYRLPWPERRVLRYLRLNAGVLFDPELVEVFIEVHAASLTA